MAAREMQRKIYKIKNLLKNGVDPETLQKTITLDDNTTVVAVSAQDFRKFFADYYSWEYFYVTDENDIDSDMNIFMQVWNTFWNRREQLYTRMWNEIFADFPFSMIGNSDVTEDTTKLTDTYNTTDTNNRLKGVETHNTNSDTAGKKMPVTDNISVTVTNGNVDISGNVTIGAESTNDIKVQTVNVTGGQTTQGSEMGTVTETGASISTGDKMTTDKTVSTYDNQSMPLTDKTEQYGDVATIGKQYNTNTSTGSTIADGATKSKEGELITGKKGGYVEHANSGKKTITRNEFRTVDEYFRGLSWSIEFGKFVDMIFHDFATECLFYTGGDDDECYIL